MAHDRLLDIAIREFGLRGLEGASTRGIAAAAGTAMSAITYHYGGKEGLYLAAADHIAEQMGADIDLGPEPQTLDDPAQARAGVHAIIDRFFMKLSSPESESRALFIMREQMHPTEAFERIYGGMMGDMLERLAALIDLASGGGDIARARMLTVTFMGQVIVLRAARASILRLARRNSVDADLITALKVRVAANIDAILDSLPPSPKELL